MKGRGMPERSAASRMWSRELTAIVLLPLGRLASDEIGYMEILVSAKRAPSGTVRV